MRKTKRQRQRLRRHQRERRSRIRWHHLDFAERIFGDLISIAHGSSLEGSEGWWIAETELPKEEVGGPYQVLRHCVEEACFRGLIIDYSNLSKRSKMIRKEISETESEGYDCKGKSILEVHEELQGMVHPIFYGDE